MAEFFHGVTTSNANKSVSSPITSESGLPFVIGAAPAHTVGGAVNEPILCRTYEEAVAAMGYSDDWEKYPVCSAIHVFFRLYGVGPLVIVNILDSAKHKKAVEEKAYTLTDGQALLPLEAMKDSVVIDGYEIGTDYELFYSGENLILEAVDGGKITAETTEINIAFNEVDPTAITENDIIGGFDPTTKKTSGLELVDKVFPKYGVVTDLILAPVWSGKSATVAAVMNKKATAINTVFSGKCVIDADAENVRHYADVEKWKQEMKITHGGQIVCWPAGGIDDKICPMSVLAAARMAATDAENDGCPAESPSNKDLEINRVCLTDGTPVLLDLTEANHLNSIGVVTAFNFIGGYKLWGNRTACFPADSDAKSSFISVGRMFGWIANSVVLSYWKEIDRKMTRRLIDSIVDSINIWLNGLTAEEKLLGGRVEFLDSENTASSLEEGKAVFHLYLTPPSPMEECEFTLEYDSAYIEAALMQ